MKSNSIAAFALLAAVTAGGLSSCHIYNKFDVASQGGAAGQQYAQALAQPLDSAAVGNLPYREVFTDPVLQDLIARALANNVDLRNAMLNVEVARANVLGAKLSYLPSAALAPQGSLSKFHMDGSSWSKTYSIPLSISWEIDVFGKILNNKRGAEAALRLQQDYLQAAHSQIICGVASCYYSIATLQAQLDLSRETSELWKQSVQTMRDFKEAGRVTEAAVQQSQGQYLSVLASIKDLESSLTRANNTLALLLNEAPQTYAVSASARLAAPAALDGLTLRQLAARPDVRAAEESLASAYYATNSARAAFYPSLALTSNGGFTNSVGGFIMNPGKWFENLAAQLTAPLFSRGQTIARLKGAKAQQQQALNNFEYKLLSAAAEVTDNIADYTNSDAKAALLNQQAAALQQAVEMTQMLMAYDGNTTYLEVLNAQSSLLQAQMGELSALLARDQALINLYQSLGGAR